MQILSALKTLSAGTVINASVGCGGVSKNRKPTVMYIYQKFFFFFFFIFEDAITSQIVKEGRTEYTQYVCFHSANLALLC